MMRWCRGSEVSKAHQGIDPTTHTLNVFSEWLSKMQKRLQNEVSLRSNFMHWSMVEAIAVLCHDRGKAFGPLSLLHPKRSFELSYQLVACILENGSFFSDEKDREQLFIQIQFLIIGHDICGHVSAGRYTFHQLLDWLEAWNVSEEIMESLFYVQLADMRAIPGMKVVFKVENIAVWEDAALALGMNQLVVRVREQNRSWFTQVDGLESRAWINTDSLEAIQA